MPMSHFKKLKLQNDWQMDRINDGARNAQLASEAKYTAEPGEIT